MDRKLVALCLVVLVVAGKLGAQSVWLHRLRLTPGREEGVAASSLASNTATYFAYIDLHAQRLCALSSALVCC